MLQRFILFVLIPTCLVLTACPAVREPPSEMPITQLGYVNLRELRSDGSGTREASASFERVAKESNIPTSEVCVVFTDDEEPSFTTPDPIDAGPEITIFAGEQPYAVLEKIEQGAGDVFYRTGGDALFSSLPPVPESRLSVTIPGDTFPAFNDVTMPPLPPAFTPDNIADLTPLTVESRIVWTPATPTAADTRSSVGFTAFLFGSSSSYVHLQCNTADDGDFKFTGEVRAILFDKDLTDGFFTEFVRYFERTEVGETDKSTARLLLSTSTVTDVSSATNVNTRLVSQ